MLGNFEYANPTKLYFGEDSLRYLNVELPKYGQTVMLTYGGGSIKKNGIYDQVVEVLKSDGKTVVADTSVMPNPTGGLEGWTSEGLRDSRGGLCGGFH